MSNATEIKFEKGFNFIIQKSQFNVKLCFCSELNNWLVIDGDTGECHYLYNDKARAINIFKKMLIATIERWEI